MNEARHCLRWVESNLLLLGWRPFLQDCGRCNPFMDRPPAWLPSVQSPATRPRASRTPANSVSSQPPFGIGCHGAEPVTPWTETRRKSFQPSLSPGDMMSPTSLEHRLSETSLRFHLPTSRLLGKQAPPRKCFLHMERSDSVGSSPPEWRVSFKSRWPPQAEF